MTSFTVLLGTLFLKPVVVVAAAAAVAATLRRHGAAARHAVWSGAIVATLALPCLHAMLPRVAIETPIAAMPAPVPATPRGATGTQSTIGSPNEAPVAGTTRAVPWPAAVLAIWMTGAVLLSTRRIVSEVRTRGMRRRARPASTPWLARLVHDAMLSSRLPRTVEFRLSGETASPAVTGIFRPVVLLPAVADTWAEADLAAVLVHELGHVARRDCLLNLLADVAAIVYWCNPAVRFAARRVRAESERACDDRVLRRGVDPEGYAHLLLRVASRAHVAGAVPEAAIAMARPRELEARLLAVLDSGAWRAPVPRWMVAGFAAVGLVVALPTAALTVQAIPVEPDRLGDAFASPASERIPRARGADPLSSGVALALAGPDSVLAGLLVAALDHEPTDDADLVRERAAWALSQVREGRLVDPLLDVLDARDWRVQAYAAWALARAHDARAVDPLIGNLDHPVWRVRAMAAYALRVAGDPRAVTAMERALLDPAWQVRVEAVQYFGALGGPSMAERLEPRLADRHVAVRLAAARALTP